MSALCPAELDVTSSENSHKWKRWTGSSHLALTRQANKQRGIDCYLRYIIHPPQICTTTPSKLNQCSTSMPPNHPDCCIFGIFQKHPALADALQTSQDPSLTAMRPESYTIDLPRWPFRAENARLEGFQKQAERLVYRRHQKPNLTP